MHARAVVVAAIGLPLAACASQYEYTPAENATASIQHQTAAHYDVPAQAPKGDVRLASFGFSKVAPANAPESKVKALHLRMVVANNNDSQPWIVDARNQQLDVPGLGRVSPTYVSERETGAGLPVVTVPPGQKRTIDLFYQLPPGMDKASKVKGFDEVWQVQTPERTVVERTPFERLEVVPTYAYAYGPWYYNYGWGPYWYPGPMWVGAPSWWW